MDYLGGKGLFWEESMQLTHFDLKVGICTRILQYSSTLHQHFASSQLDTLVALFSSSFEKCYEQRSSLLQALYVL